MKENPSSFPLVFHIENSPVQQAKKYKSISNRKGEISLFVNYEYLPYRGIYHMKGWHSTIWAKESPAVYRPKKTRLEKVKKKKRHGTLTYI